MADELMGRNEYARHRGCAPNAVAKAEEDGRIAAAVERDAAGKFLGIRWRQADELWARNTDIDQAMRGNGGALPPGPARTEQAAPLIAPSAEQVAAADRVRADEDVRGDLLEQKLRSQRADAEMREMELAARRGELVPVEEQRRVNTRRYRAIRDQMLGIPDRLGWLSREDRMKLTAEIKRVLHELSDDATAAAGAESAQPVVADEERVAA